MNAARIDRTLWPALALLAAVFLLFEFTPLDLAIQDRFFDFEKHAWCVDAANPLWRALFYTGPKGAIILIGLALLALTLGPESWRAHFDRAQPRRANFLVALLTLASVPIFVGQLKARTNVFCPSEIRRYGGKEPYVRVLEHYPSNDRPATCGHCFPAGHASGGFALIGLVGLARTRRAKRLALAVALGAGGLMGWYQMAKGAHYLSHTVITALIAWIFFLGWRRIFLRD